MNYQKKHFQFEFEYILLKYFKKTKAIKQLRHPSILKYVDSQILDKNHFFLATSKVVPLVNILQQMEPSEILLGLSEIAVKKNLPMIIIPSSGGARMQEGILSLMQMPRTIAAIQKIKENKIPYIVVLSDPTTGGVCASFAMLGDILIAEKGAMIGFAGRRVIEQTIKESIPDNFQTADYLLEHGMIDMVVHRKDLKNKIYKILKFIEKKKLNESSL